MRLSAPLRRLLPASLSASLIRLAAVFLGAYAVALTLSPAVRERTFEELGDLRWLHWLGFAVWLAAFLLLDRQARRALPGRDPLLIPLAGLLSGWGLLTIWRLTTEFGLRQTLWVAVCTLLFVVGLLFKDQILPLVRRYKYLWLLAGFLITALTFLFGTNPSAPEPRLWLGCCGVYFQPSEVLKVLLVIYLAAYLADRQPLTRGWLALLAPTALMTGLALLLLLVQRDLGTAWVFIFIYMIMIFAAAGKRRVLVASAFILVVALVAGYSLVGLVHQRVEIWLNPWTDPTGSGYQIVQGLLAVASGGAIGRGPGMGSPGVVPVSHSDFIYTSIVEETGLVGAVGLLMLVALLCLRALRISLNAPDAYQRYLAIGLSAYLASQSLLIIGGNIRLLPLTGVTLPFVSYGGSSMLVSFFALLLLCIVSNGAKSRYGPLVRPAPTLTIAGIILFSFGAAALVTGWWSIARGPDLLTRADNTRRARSDRFVVRGALVDRYGVVLSETLGQPGSYERRYLAPELGNVLGYSNPNLGQAGLEDGLDPILRGEELQPPLGLWANHVLYGQPSPGLDVRLTLDADLSVLANDALSGQHGAAVLLNGNGEILAMASQPGYDPRTLEADWSTLAVAEDSPLVNRAVQGAYPPGSALGPFLLAAARAAGLTLDLPTSGSYNLDGRHLLCLERPDDPEDWTALVAASCPGALAQLGLALGGDRLLALYRDLGFYTAPAIPMELHASASPINIQRPEAAATGQDGLLVSPLQMALAACSLSNFGQLPSARLVLEVEQAGGGWISYEESPPASEVLGGAFSTSVAQNVANDDLGIWELTARAYGEDDELFTWYIAGELAEQGSAGRCVAVLLEIDDAATARAIGRELLAAD